MPKHPLMLASLFLAACSACGHNQDDKSAIPEQTTRSQEATVQTVDLDGHAVAFFALGDAADYEGALQEQDSVYMFTTSRAFKLDAPKTLYVKDSVGSSSDCAAADYTGPQYMVLLIKPGSEPQIVRSTEGIESGGQTIPASDLATFPGALAAGTYVISADYLSFNKACTIKGHFSLTE